jgi:predicted nuclease of predicted toxin-antitoxin system
MRFKVDENLPAEIRDDLRALGHEAETVTDEGMAGVPDATLLAKVQVERRVFLTLDKGIANIRVYPPQQYPGIVLFRPRTTARSVVLSFIRQHMPTVLQLNLNGHLVVVSEAGMRIR